MSASEPLISIVVPVYNVEAYLHKCVDSILAQTYRNIEVILINDGSPDKSPEVCDNYAKEDSRVIVIHQKNGGLSDARNTGIEVASGSWISFIDSDDWVERDFIERLLNLAIRHKADIGICGYRKVLEGGVVEATTIKPKPQATVMNNLDALRDLLTRQRYGGVMTWNKLYRACIFTDNNIRFPKGRVHEDNFTTYKTFYYANKVAYMDEPLYNYLQRGDSIMGEPFSLKRLDILDAVSEADQFVRSRKLDLLHEVDFYRVITRIGLLQNIQLSKSRSEFHSVEKKLLVSIARSRGTMRGNNILRTRDKLRLYLASAPTLYGWFTFVRYKLRSTHK